jgi:hypothetical protein
MLQNCAIKKILVSLFGKKFVHAAANGRNKMPSLKFLGATAFAVLGLGHVNNKDNLKKLIFDGSHGIEE